MSNNHNQQQSPGRSSQTDIMGQQTGGSADLIALAYKKRRLNNLSRASKNSREKSKGHDRSVSGLSEGRIKNSDGRHYKERKELEKRLINRKIETTNPYVVRKEKLDHGSELSFTGIKVGHGSKATTDPQFYMDEKPQTAERTRKTRAHRMSIQMESDKSEKQREQYLKSLLNDEQQQIFEQDLLNQNRTLPVEKIQKVQSDNSGCLEDGIGNEYINSSIHEQFNEIIESSTNLLQKKKKTPKKLSLVPLVSPAKARNINQSVMQKTGKKRKMTEKRKSFDNLKMPPQNIDIFDEKFQSTMKESTSKKKHKKNSSIKKKKKNLKIEEPENVEEENAVQTPMESNISFQKEKSMNFKKDLIALKLNQRMQKLNEQKAQGDQEFEISKIQLKEFYRQIRSKIDEQEKIVTNQLKGNIFIRSQNFSRMINQIQFELESLPLSQMYEYTKNSTDQVLSQADKFLSVEKSVSDNEDPLDDTLVKKDNKIIKMPNYSSEVLMRLIKVEINTQLYNCDKFDFIQQQLNHLVSLDSSLGFNSNSKVVRSNKSPEKGLSDTQMLKKLINTPSKTSSNQISPDKESSSSSEEEDEVEEKEEENEDEKEEKEPVKQIKKKKKKKSKSKNIKSFKRLEDSMKKASVLNYQRNQESERNGSFKSSPIKFMQSTCRSVLSPKKQSAKKTLNEDLDYDLDKQLVEALKRHEQDQKEKNDKKMKKVLEKAPKLTNKSIQSIQNHIQRLQTTGSLETIDRGGHSAQLNSSKSVIKLPGGIAQPPLLSNMKYHPGHTFGKSDLNSRRGTVVTTERQQPGGGPNFQSTLSKAISQDSFSNFRSTFNKANSPPKERKVLNKHSSSVSEFNLKKESVDNIKGNRKKSQIPIFTDIQKKKLNESATQVINSSKIVRRDASISSNQDTFQAKKIKPLTDVKPHKEVILMTTAPEEEQTKLNQNEEIHSRQRMFTKIISQADRIQFQWSHPTSAASGGSNDLQYVLEYGCGIKFQGVEQFRKIYQGKAHKCIVADLMPKTKYRFRVKPVKIEVALDEGGKNEIISQGKWSEIIGVTTLDK